jgi:hypothetical protein
VFYIQLILITGKNPLIFCPGPEPEPTVTSHGRKRPTAAHTRYRASELPEHQKVDEACEKVRTAEQKKRNRKKEYVNLLLQNDLRMKHLLAEEIEMIIGGILRASIHVSQYGDLYHNHDDHDEARHYPQKKLQVTLRMRSGRNITSTVRAPASMILLMAVLMKRRNDFPSLLSTY